MSAMNRRWIIHLRVTYFSGAHSDETQFGWGETAMEAENDAMERRWRAADEKYIGSVFVMGSQQTHENHAVWLNDRIREEQKREMISP